MTKALTSNNTFYKSFSGTDALAFMILPDAAPILLGTLTTVSYSMYRDKKPVSLIGRINVSGYTRGMRIIAGTLIFTLINQHFTKDLMAQVPYLKNAGKIKADELPLFDIIVVCANEYGYASQLEIYGVDITDDAQALTIQEILIENSFNFVARDIDELTAINTTSTSKRSSSSKVNNGNINAVMPYNFTAKGYKANAKKLALTKTSNPQLLTAQKKLNNLRLLSAVNGKMDTDTVSAVKSFQRQKGLLSTGVLDNVTYNTLLNKDEEKITTTISNKRNAFVYDTPTKDRVIGIAKYQEGYIGEIRDNFLYTDFCGFKGYIELDDVKCGQTNNSIIENKCANTLTLAYDDSFVPENIGCIYTSDLAGEVRISTISIYDNDNTKSYLKELQVQKDVPIDLNLSLMQDSYLFDTEEESLPKYIEFIICTTRNEPLKWRINFKK